MQCSEGVLVDGFDRDGPDVLVACCLKEPLGVGAIGTVAGDVGSDPMRRQEDDVVAGSAHGAVRRSAGFEEYRARLLLGEEGE